MTNPEDHRSIEPPKQRGRQRWLSEGAPQSRPNDAEIPPGEWTSFLESFSQQHEGWLASISVNSGGRRSVRVSNYRFAQITIAQEGEQHQFRISVEGNRGDHLVHEVPNPLRLTFKRDLRGAHEGLDITSADDSVTTLRSSSRGIVLFAHGSGSSRHSPRNKYVAQVLQQAGLATLLMDLLTSDEESLDARTASLRFDIELLARRLIEATRWLIEQPQTAPLRIGYFGASTGAAAALVAAAELPDLVAAVVSRGGRPDLADGALRQVVAPTLLIVGGNDRIVFDLNRKALAELHGEKRLEIVPGAGHLFEEPGTLESVAGMARNWFGRYLNGTRNKPQAA